MGFSFVLPFFAFRAMFSAARWWIGQNFFFPTTGWPSIGHTFGPDLSPLVELVLPLWVPASDAQLETLRCRWSAIACFKSNKVPAPALGGKCSPDGAPPSGSMFADREATRQTKRGQGKVRDPLEAGSFDDWMPATARKRSLNGCAQATPRFPETAQYRNRCTFRKACSATSMPEFGQPAAKRQACPG